jgi:CRISPR-associated protein Csm4
MSTWRLVRLLFGRSPVHFGELGIGMEETSERVRSDTLFSGLMNAYARLYGSQAIEALLKRFIEPEQPPFRLSSTFLWREVENSDAKQSSPIYYLPKPIAFPRNYPVGEDFQFSKSYRKLIYLPLPLWKRWYQSEGFHRANDPKWLKATSVEQEKLTVPAGVFEYSSGFKEERIPHVSIDRSTHTSNLYHTSFVRYQWDANADKQQSLSGLYFLLRLDDETLEQEIRAAFEFLGEEGLGGERSSGAGRFELEWKPLTKEWQELVKFEKATQHCLLSLYLPETLPPEIKDAQYEFVERGGWIGSPFSGRQLRRKSVRMFAEGSVFESVKYFV